MAFIGRPALCPPSDRPNQTLASRQISEPVRFSTLLRCSIRRGSLKTFDFPADLYQNEIMRLIGQNMLSKAVRKHADARKWLVAWAATVEDATWQSLDDVRADYPSADGVKLKSEVVVTVFNVKGNEYRLITNVNYNAQAVLFLELLTHAGYDKEKWKGRY